MKLAIEERQQYETEMLKEVHDICQRNNIDYFLAYGSVIGAIRHQGPIPWDSDADIVVPYNQFDEFISTVREELPEKFYLDYYDTNKFYPTLFPRIGLKGYSTHRLHVDVFKLVGGPSDEKKQVRYQKKARFYRNIFVPKNARKKYFGDFSFDQKMYLYFIKILLFLIPNKLIIKSFERHCSKYPYDKAEFAVNANGAYGMKEVQPKSLYGEGRVVNYSNIEVKIPEQYDTYLRNFYGDYTQPPPEEERKISPFINIIEL